MKLTIEVNAKKGKFQELYQTLQALLPTLRKVNGCRDCRIYRDTESEEGFFLSVSWEEQASLHSYLRSNSGAALLGAIDVLSETSRVRIGAGDASNGIQMLKNMRKETSHEDMKNK